MKTARTPVCPPADLVRQAGHPPNGTGTDSPGREAKGVTREGVSPATRSSGRGKGGEGGGRFDTCVQIVSLLLSQ